MKVKFRQSYAKRAHKVVFTYFIVSPTSLGSYVCNCAVIKTLLDLSLISCDYFIHANKTVGVRNFYYAMFSTDGVILCDGYAARASWTAWIVYCVFIQRSSQVQDFSSVSLLILLIHTLILSIPAERRRQ